MNVLSLKQISKSITNVLDHLNRNVIFTLVSGSQELRDCWWKCSSNIACRNLYVLYRRAPNSLILIDLFAIFGDCWSNYWFDIYCMFNEIYYYTPPATVEQSNIYISVLHSTAFKFFIFGKTRKTLTAWYRTFMYAIFMLD